jgi:hypothetical protein
MGIMKNLVGDLLVEQKKKSVSYDFKRVVPTEQIFNYRMYLDPIDQPY